MLTHINLIKRTQANLFIQIVRGKIIASIPHLVYSHIIAFLASSFRLLGTTKPVKFDLISKRHKSKQYISFTCLVKLHLVNAKSTATVQQ